MCIFDSSSLTYTKKLYYKTMVVLLVAPCDDQHVMIDINHVTIDDFDVMIDRICDKRQYLYDDVDVTVDTKDVTEIVAPNFHTM